MAEQEAITESTGRRRVSAIWIVPLVAIGIGIWLAVDAYRSQGPVVTLAFSSADGLKPDRTPVKVRSVEVGMVTTVRLSEDLQGVEVTAELDQTARRLLREDTQFWVVRPRISGGSVSGLDTLLSGVYIEMSPGKGPATGKREFSGLDSVPLTPAGTPGLRLILTSEASGTLGAGSPVLFHGYQVGMVESADLDIETREVHYSIFIDAPYDELVSTTTRFWNAGGISAELGPQGMEVNVSSLRSALVGAVAFDLPAGSEAGEPVADRTGFTLYPNRKSIDENPHLFVAEYLVTFEDTIRGLSPGAPVSYRGVQVGTVDRILAPEVQGDMDVDAVFAPVPVILRIEPARMGLGDTEEGVARARRTISQAVDLGMRAALETGSLLGSRFISLDFYPDEGEAEVGRSDGYPTIPTVEVGFDQLWLQITRLLDKLNDLPLGGTLNELQRTTAELRMFLASSRDVVDADETRRIAAELNRTLEQLRGALDGLGPDSDLRRDVSRAVQDFRQMIRSVDDLAEQLERQPNTLLFPRPGEADPEPEVPDR